MTNPTPKFRLYIGRASQTSESYTLERVCGNEVIGTGIGTFDGVAKVIKTILFLDITY